MKDAPHRLYVADPMSGIAEYNYAQFRKITELLRDQGYEGFNPAENSDGDV